MPFLVVFPSADRVLLVKHQTPHVRILPSHHIKARPLPWPQCPARLLPLTTSEPIHCSSGYPPSTPATLACQVLPTRHMLASDLGACYLPLPGLFFPRAAHSWLFTSSRSLIKGHPLSEVFLSQIITPLPTALSSFTFVHALVTTRPILDLTSLCVSLAVFIVTLVYLGCITKYYSLSGLSNRFISHCSGGWKSRCWQMIFILRPCLLTRRRPRLAVCSHDSFVQVPKGQRGGGKNQLSAVCS